MKYRISNFFYIVVCFCLLTVASSLTIFSNRNYEKATHKIVDFDSKNVSSVYLRVSDVYGQENQESLSAFFSEKNALERMKTFSRFANREFTFLEFDTQPLLLRSDSFPYEVECRNDYGSDIYGANDKIGISLKSVQINQKAYELLSLSDRIKSGRGFQTSDFSFDDQTVPAVLGYNYSKNVTIGQLIRFNYLDKEISVKVIGFFKQDTSVTINNNIHFLDNYISIPFFDEKGAPQDLSDERFQKILYSLKNWGYIKIKSGEDYFDYKEKVDQVSRSLDLKYILNEGSVFPYIKNISNSMQSSQGILRMVTIFLFFVFSSLFFGLTVWNFNKNRKTYAIHLISGCSFPRLKIRIFIGIWIQLFASFALSSLINFILLGQNRIYASELELLEHAVGQTAVLSMTVMAAVCLLLNRYLNRCNLYQSIQKED